jgi:hypothetical protein
VIARSIAPALFIAAIHAPAVCAQPGAVNPGLRELPLHRWTIIHEQSSRDEVQFKRQAHGGGAFDSRRGRIVLFGSDTHGEDWTNTPLFFDLSTLTWSRLHENDDPSTYRVDLFGVPVAGPQGDRPWAMHTFGAVVYHERLDSLIVSSLPEHLQPGRFTDAMTHVWPKIRRHPTWILDLSRGRWRQMAGPAEHFFPYATAYDSERGVVIGYKASGVFELSGQLPSWRKVAGPGLLGYHNNAVFDARHKALVVFGSNENSNDIVVYDPASGSHRRMPTPGLRPPKSQHRPMAFHREIGQTVVLFDRTEAAAGAGAAQWAETWLYDLERDAWTEIAAARLPFHLGMNYNLVYDSLHNLLLLVAAPPDRQTSVWALRL